ncbi:MAG: aminoacyl-tRNA hydrolase [Candidatus Marinimicrobia bacterium]|jgi:PTH1 family peptidyl-tRNA hydrolase|nr:aminoacyl-tRNA hydrolase [Candidatus Neomarinimicrobiota bacterium]
MIAFVGLGNPGDNYANTKHNAGFWVVDELARRQKLSFKPGKGDYVFAQHQRQEVLLIKPTTGMNRSGIAVKDAASRWGLFPADIHVVVDDVDLPLGSVRIRPKGGDGCHRGVENIIYHLQSDQFPRIRLGIGTDENMRPAEKFVLKPFRTDDEPEAEIMVKRATDALENLLIRGINHTMNHFNS